MSESPSFDVAIVGCGPVGAALGNLLGSQGISVCIIERDPTAYSLPRAGHFDDEVMRVWQTLGLSEQVRAGTHVNPGMRFVDAEGKTLLNWPRPPEVGPQAWHASYRFHQPALEQVLRAGLTRYDHVSLRLGCAVEEIVQLPESVALAYRDLGGETASVTARYVIGCDGGRSTVRLAMGAVMEDLGTHEDWLVVDVILKRPRDDLGWFTVQYCDPARPTTYACCVGERRRWEFMVLPGEDPVEIAQPESVWRLVQPWITQQDAEIERSTVYTFHGMIADRWRDGRLLLAGDAAHLMPPFLGQGMCSGVRDADNLAWKLINVLRGVAPDSLLDSYQVERDPHVREYVKLAVKLGSIVQVRDPELARQRDEQLAGNPELLMSIKPRLGHSVINSGGGLSGTLSEQIRLRDGALLDDAAGFRFVLLLNDTFAATVPPALLAAFADADVAVMRGEGEDYLARLNVDALVIRPDRYVMAGARSAGDLEAILDTIPARQPETI